MQIPLLKYNHKQQKDNSRLIVNIFALTKNLCSGPTGNTSKQHKMATFSSYFLIGNDFETFQTFCVIKTLIQTLLTQQRGWLQMKRIITNALCALWFDAQLQHVVNNTTNTEKEEISGVAKINSRKHSNICTKKGAIFGTC